MLIAKNGIFREIDETKLQAYREKGYTPQQLPAPASIPAAPPDAEGKAGKKA